jgi:hypothetical protein
VASGLDFLPPEDPRIAAISDLLSSGVFERSPGQERLFLYLCKRAVLGQSEDLKEYTIAIEAFGRSSDFDPKLDSIVRVEMHRLRRRLRDHYAAKGASSPTRVILPDKSYQIEFQAAGAAPASLADSPAKETRWTWWAIVAAVLTAAIFLGWSNWFPSADSPPAAASVVVSATPRTPEPKSAPGGEIRILCGRPAMRYVDPYGHIWEGDRYFSGGEAAALETTGANSGYDQNIFAGMRAGTFQYEIPLPPGPHELTLIFSEPAVSAANSPASTEETREFAVRVPGRTLLVNYDIKDAAGGYNTPHLRVFKDIHAASDGKLRLRFESSAQRSFVNAIVLRPGLAGRLRPVRIVARREPFRDAQGNLWEPDQYFRGGRQILRPIPPRVPDGFLYIGERHGTFQYDIPVATGSRYTANLHFWESWWALQQDGGPGSRVFSVYCNFRPLMERFDLLATKVQPPVVRKSFRGLEPDENGRLSFAFVPAANRAMINAIEILDEGSTPP